MDAEISEILLKLFHQVGGLKNLSRAGWFRCGIAKPESVAEHTFRTSFIAMLMADYLKLDTEKILKMTLLHDLAEVVVGDITPYDNETAAAKIKKEEIAIYGLLREIPERDTYISIWQDFAYQESTEAKLVRNIDKLEMALQAFEYQKEKPGLDLKEFFIDAEKYIDDPEVQKIFKELSKGMAKLPRQARL